MATSQKKVSNTKSFLVLSEDCSNCSKENPNNQSVKTIILQKIHGHAVYIYAVCKLINCTFSHVN